MIRVLNGVFFIISIITSISAFSAEIMPTQYVAGDTTSFKIMEGSEEITNQYNLSSTNVIFIEFSSKKYAVGKIAGSGTIVAQHKSDSTKNKSFQVNVVPGKPFKLEIASGNLQVGVIKTALSEPLKVRVLDLFNNPVSGFKVKFRTSEAGAVISPSESISDQQGISSASYTAGDVQKVERVEAVSSVRLSRNSSVSFSLDIRNEELNAPASIALVVPTESITAQVPFTVKATVLNHKGGPVVTYTTPVSLKVFKNSGCTVPTLDLSGTRTLVPASGVSTFSGVSYSRPEYIYIQASSGSLKSKCSPQIPIKKATGPAALAFSSNPISSVKGELFNPNIRVSVLDGAGKAVNAPTEVSIEAYTNSECTTAVSSALFGKTSVLSILGTASFPDLKYQGTGSLYFKAKSGTVSSPCSSLISVSENIKESVSAISFLSSFPTSGQANQKLGYNPSIILLNTLGSIVASAKPDVTISAYTNSSCSTPATGTLFSDPEVGKPEKGVVSFKTISYSKPETIYIKAQAGSISACSKGIEISSPDSGRPNSLAAVQTPQGDVDLGSTILTPVKIEARDVNNSKTALFSAQVTLISYTDSSCSIKSSLPEHIISGKNGTAVFSLVPISIPGQFYAKATSGILTSSCFPLVNILPPSTSLLGSNKKLSTQLNSYIPLIIDYRNIITAPNNDYSNVTYSVVGQNLGTGEYACSSATSCIYIPTEVGTYSMRLKGVRSTGETAFADVTIEVFSGENVPEFASATKQIIEVRQGETIDFNLITASSGSDGIRYEMDRFPDVGTLSHCLNLQFADNGNTDISCKFLATGNLYSTSFTYKAVNTTNNKFSIREVQINILDSENILDVFPSRWASISINDAGSVFARGLNDSKVIGVDFDYKPANYVFEATNVIKVALKDRAVKVWVKGNGAIAKLENGEYYAWGQNRRSKLGIQSYNPSGDIIYKPQKVTIFNYQGQSIDFTQISINENSSCGLSSKGMVFCWGSNEFSELAISENTPNYGYAQLRLVDFGKRVDGVERVASFLADSSTGANHHCAIVENEAYCWGLNSNGQLGVGKTDVQLPSTYIPTKVLISENVKKIAVGSSFTCAITNSDRVKCWGKNDVGQLGYGDTAQRGHASTGMQELAFVNLGADANSQPLKSREVYVGAGGSSVCSILMDYRVKCWGKNDLGQLGYGDLTNRGSASSHMGNNLPYLKSDNNLDLLAFYLRSSGEEDFCLRSNVDTKVYCWGNNQFRSIAPAFPNLPSTPKEYKVSLGETAPFLVAGASIERTFTTNQGQNKTISTIAPTYFKDLFSSDDEIKYFFDESSVNVYTGYVYDQNDPTRIAGRLDPSCLGGVTKTQFSACQFTPANGYSGSFVLKYKACSINLKCSDQLITVAGRVTDPNIPYFSSVVAETVYNLERFEQKQFTIDLPFDPQNRPVGLIASNDSIKMGPNYPLILDSEGNTAGIITGCFVESNQNTEITASNFSNYRRNSCNFIPKETFNGTVSLKYRAKNSAGYLSEEKRVTFVVRNNYQNVLHAIGYLSSNSLGRMVRFPEMYSTSPMYNSSMYFLLGGSDNNIYSGTYSSKEMYPVPYFNMVVSGTAQDYPASSIKSEVLSDIISIKGKDGDICAVKGQNKNVVCWSKNFDNMNSGQINSSVSWWTQENRYPRYIVNKEVNGLLSDVSEVFPGETFSCAIQGPQKEVVCWGRNVKGCGGTFTPGVPCSVVKQDDTGILMGAKSISVGRVSACAIATVSNQDKLYCWGFKLDANGAGTVTRTFDSSPSNHYDKAVEISLPSSPVKAAVADTSACVSAQDNKVYCFGANSYGLLGRSPTRSSNIYHDPAAVQSSSGDLLVKPQTLDISVSQEYYDYACAVGQNNHLQCWGASLNPKLFSSVYQNPQAKQITLNEPAIVAEVSVGVNAMCIRLEDGKVKCWGNNSYGQTGNDKPFTWHSYEESDYVRVSPNGAPIQAKEIAFSSDDSSSAQLFFISQNIIENHGFYQQGKSLIEVNEGDKTLATLTNSLDVGDEIVIMKKPDYGILSATNDPKSFEYAPSVNLGLDSNSSFDYITFYKISNPTIVYRYYFETKPINNRPISKDYFTQAYKGSPSYIYSSNLGSDPEHQTISYQIVSQPTKGVLSECYSTPSHPVNHFNYCAYTPNTSAVVGDEDVFTYKIFDGVTYSEQKTVKITILDDKTLAAAQSSMTINTLSFYDTVFEPIRPIGINGYPTQVTTISGLVNDGGIFKVKDDSDKTIATITAGCFLTGNVYSPNCTLKPIRGAVGSSTIVYKGINGAASSSNLSIVINIGTGITNALYGVGSVSNTSSGVYQNTSYLYRLQGGTDPSIYSSDAYPFPIVAKNIFSQATPRNDYYQPEAKEILVNIDKIYTNKEQTDNYCVSTKDGSAYCFGDSKTNNVGGKENFAYTNGSSFNKIFLNDGSPLTEVKEMTIGSSQGCAAHGVDKKMACWGRTGISNIDQNSILRSGCGSADTVTRRGFACNVVKRDGSILSNVEKVSSYLNSTCAIVNEGGKGQLYCWGFRFDGNGVDSRSESNRAHNTNYAEKIPGFDEESIVSIALMQNKGCVGLESGKVACLGGTNYWGAKGRDDLSGKWIGATKFILDAKTSESLELRKIVDESVIVEFPVSQNFTASASNWSISNDDESSISFTLEQDRTVGSTVFKSVKFKINNKKPYSVSLNTGSSTISGSVTGVFANPSSLVSNTYSYCIKSEDSNVYCWGYDSGKFLSQTEADQNFTSNEVRLIPWMNTLVPNKKLAMSDSGMCLIDLQDEVKCWGYTYGLNFGVENKSWGQYVSYSNTDYIRQRVDGPPIKAKDIKTGNPTIILSEPAVNINLDPQPIEVTVAKNGSSSELIPNIDTAKYEYYIIKKPDSGILSGEISSLGYSPNSNFIGTDSFTYRIYDKARNYSIVNTVILKVGDRDLPPKAEDGFHPVVKNMQYYFTLAGSDPEGKTITYSVVESPMKAKAFYCSNSGCYYTPNDNYVGLDSFTFRTYDGTNYSVPATINFDVRADKKPYFDNSLATFNVGKGIRKFDFTVPRAKFPHHGSGDGYYKILIDGINTVLDYDKTVLFKDSFGADIARASNCFIVNQNFSSERNCSINFLNPFIGKLSFQYKAINPQFTEEGNHSVYVQVDINVGSGGKTLYALGHVTSDLNNNGAGHFEPSSLEYRLRGGHLGNSQVSRLSDKELFPVPFVYKDTTVNNVADFDSGSTGACWFNNDETKEAFCLTRGNPYGAYGRQTSWSYYSLSGPVQKITYADGSAVSGVKKIKTGVYQSCAIAEDNTVACWGNTPTNTVAPTHVDSSGCGFAASVTPVGGACKIVNDSNSQISNVTDVSVGHKANGCLISKVNELGKVYCWGESFENGATKQSAKEEVDLNTGSATKVAVGDQFVCVAYNDNSVKCKGQNSQGRLGIGQSSSSWYSATRLNFFDTDGITPIEIKPHTLKVKSSFGCVQDINNRVHCWGYSSHGVLAVGVDSNRYASSTKPIIINSKTTTKSFNLGNNGICYVNGNDSVTCQGDNSYGQLGNARYLIENTSTKLFDDVNVIAESESRAIVDYVSKSEVKAEGVFMSDAHTYLLVGPDNVFDVPYIDQHDIISYANENEPFSFSLGTTENTYYIFRRPDFGTVQGSTPQELIFVAGEQYQQAFVDYITFMIKDMFGNTTVKRYIFKVSPQEDKPVYVNKEIITYSNSTVGISHQATDPDSNSFKFTVVQQPALGQLVNCSGAYCEYKAPIRSAQDGDLVEQIFVRVNDKPDGSGNDSMSLGVITITVKPIANPVFSKTFVDYTMFTKEERKTLRLPKAKDPRGSSLSYQGTNNTIRTTQYLNLGSVAMVYDKTDINKEAGYITGCALANGGNASDMNACSFNVKAGYTGTVRFQYLASNGTEASSVVSVEITVNSTSIASDVVYVTGHSSYDMAGIQHSTTGQDARIDLFIPYTQNEAYVSAETIVDPALMSGVEGIYNNPSRHSMCVKKKSILDNNSSKIECSMRQSENYFGVRTPFENFHPGKYLEQRFVPLNDYTGKSVQIDILDFAVGASQSCARIAPYNEVVCWGETSDYGVNQDTARTAGCGFATSTTNANIPCKIVDTNSREIDNVIDLGIGRYNKCVVRNNDGVGQILCWGYQNWGKNGQPFAEPYNYSTEENFARVVPGTESFNFRNVESGDTFSCAETTSGTVVCWGQNRSGQLGNGTQESFSYEGAKSYAPQEITVKDGTTPVSVKPGTLSVNGNTACVIGVDHKIYCWGSNISNYIYDDNTGNKTSPTKISQLPSTYDFKKIKLGTSGACGILTTDEVVCWGYNSYNMLSSTVSGWAEITKSQAQKVIDPDTQQPILVKDVILSQYNVYFIKKVNQ